MQWASLFKPDVRRKLRQELAALAASRYENQKAAHVAAANIAYIDVRESHLRSLLALGGTTPAVKLSTGELRTSCTRFTE